MNMGNEEHLLIRELEPDDFFKGYPELMYEFTNYAYTTTLYDFSNAIKNSTDYRKTMVFINIKTDKIIGAGTVFKLIKLHNNPVGHIEDVIITQSYREKRLGKILINELVNIAINEFKCYKVILNCLYKNIGFYVKCGFEVSGVEMKLIKNNN